MDSQVVPDTSSGSAFASDQAGAGKSSGVDERSLGAQDETKHKQLDAHAATNGQKKNEGCVDGPVHLNDEDMSNEYDGLVFKSDSEIKSSSLTAQNITDLRSGDFENATKVGEKRPVQFGESWIIDDGPEMDVFGDGSLRMRTLRPGAERDSRPQNGERARFSYRVALADGEPRTILERRDVEAAIGDADVLFGIETALKFIERGALVRARIAARFAYGVHGLPPAIPPNADLLAEIELHGVDPPVDWRRAHVAARRAFIEAKLSRASFYESLDQHSNAAICISRASSVELSIAPDIEDVSKVVTTAVRAAANECEVDDSEHAEADTSGDKRVVQQVELDPASAISQNIAEAAPKRPLLQRSVSDTETRRENSEPKEKPAVRLIMLLTGFVLLAAFATSWFRSRTAATE